jgi:alpha-D-xyloside xylohydrolase
MQLLPYFYSTFADYYKKGIPPVRAMILEDRSFLDGKVIDGKLDSELNPYAEGKVVDETDQFMFGPSILVAPFYESHATSRRVSLPGGNWYDFYTGEFAGNRETITVAAAELGDKIPLFVKEGAIIPMLTKTVKCTREAYGHPLEVRVYGSSEGMYDLYEDDGVSFEYRKGSYRIRRMTVTMNNDGELSLSEDIVRNESEPMFGPIQSVTFMSR